MERMIYWVRRLFLRHLREGEFLSFGANDEESLANRLAFTEGGFVESILQLAKSLNVILSQDDVNLLRGDRLITSHQLFVDQGMDDAGHGGYSRGLRFVDYAPVPEVSKSLGEWFEKRAMYIPKSYKQEVQLPVLDQGTFPTCAAAASASAMSYILKTKHSTNPYAASIAQLWNSAKSIDGKEGKAGMEGTELSSIIKGAVHFGWLYECELPYLKKNIYPHNTFTNQALFSFQSGRVPKKDLSAPTIRTESPAKRAPSLLKIALLKQKSIVIGSSWFSFWWTPSVKNSGVLPMPFPWEKSEGGHAVTIIGWEDVEGVDGGGYFYIQNSWGKNWGDEGYGRIPYAYFERGLIGGSILFS